MWKEKFKLIFILIQLSEKHRVGKANSWMLNYGGGNPLLHEVMTLL